MLKRTIRLRLLGGLKEKEKQLGALNLNQPEPDNGRATTNTPI